LLCLAVLSAGGYAQRYGFKHYDRNSGLLDEGVHALLQDRTGFLWIGTENGLYRYDGQRFRGFSVADGLPAAEVHAIHQSEDGTLWAATPRGLARLRGERFETVDISPGTGANAVGSDSFGRLYVALSKGLLVLSLPVGGAGKPISILYRVPELKTQTVRSIAVSATGSVWYTCGTGLCRLENGRAVLADGQGVPEDMWYSVLFDHEENLWARSREKLIELPKGESRFLRRDAGLPPAYSGKLQVGQDGQLWVPTSRGLARRIADGWEIIGKSRGLPVSSVTCALEDREGSMWIGMWGGGLARWLGYPNWDQWTETEGLSSESVWGIQRDSAGVLWTVTDAGVSHFDESAGRWRDLRIPGLPAGVTAGLAWAPDGSMWLAQASGPVHVDLRRGVATAYGRESGMDNPWVSTIAVDPQNRVWAGTTNGLYLAARRGGGSLRFERQRLPAEGKTEYVETSLVDRTGRLWVGGWGGLLRLEAGRWTRFTAADGLLNDRVSKLAEAPDGSLWISYAEPVGVSQLVFDGQRPRWRHFSSKDGLRSGKVFFIGCDRRGWTWFGSDQGVDHSGRPPLAAPRPHRRAGLGRHQCQRLLGRPRRQRLDRHQPGHLPSANSLASGLPSRPTAAPVLLTSAALGGSNVGLGLGISVPWSRRSLNDWVCGLDVRQRGHRALPLSHRRPGRALDRNPVARSAFPQPARRKLHLRGAVQCRARPLAGSARAPRLHHPSRVVAQLVVRTGGPGHGRALLARLVWDWRVRSMLRRQKELEDAVADRTRSLNLEKARAEGERDTVEQQKIEIEHLLREVRQAARLKDQFLCQHQPRNPHAHERHHRYDRTGSRYRSHGRTAGVPADGAQLIRIAARHPERGPRSLEGSKPARPNRKRLSSICPSW
jgi:ligand-binding sensor domain-containing protein